MLIDNEDESLSELDAVEQKKQLPEVAPLSEMPEKYRQKSLEEVVKMHQEAEKLIGKQAQEVGEVRKLADELIKQNLSSKQQPIEEEPEVDFFENPQEAVRRTVDNHPDVLAARQAGQEFDFGYAITCHKSQGSQWNNVLIYDESWCFRDDWKRWLYTAITRASEKITLVKS